jgi:hypothetical protein
VKDFELSRFRRARVWVNEDPFDGPSEEIAPATTLCVEVFVPKGPLLMYGLLGGAWGGEGRASTDTGATSSRGKHFIPLSSAVTDFRLGVPPPLLAEAIDRARTELAQRGDGEVHILWGGFSETWSNQIVFGALGEVIAAGLASGARHDAVAELLETRLP